MKLEYAWTETHKYARIIRKHRAVFGFWFAKDETGSEFAINLGVTVYLWRCASLATGTEGPANG